MQRDSDPVGAIPDGATRPWMPMPFIYGFFGLHMLGFGLSTFFMAYSDSVNDPESLFMFGGFSLSVYMVFYLVIFGLDQIKWMLINAGLGILGIYSQLGWLLARFGKNVDDYPWTIHALPVLYYVMYTFLLRQFLIDVTRSRDKPGRLRLANNVYVAGSLLVYGWMLLR